MKITKTYLESLEPCEDRWEHYLEHYSNWEGSIIDFVDLPEITIDDIFWVLDKTDALKPKHFVELAVIFAEDVLPIFEAEYPGNKRPRHAIEAAKYGNVTLTTKEEAEYAMWTGWASTWERLMAASAAKAASSAVLAAAWAAERAGDAIRAERAATYAVKAAAYAVCAADSDTAKYQKKLWQRQQIKKMLKQSMETNHENNQNLFRKLKALRRQVEALFKTLFRLGG